MISWKVNVAASSHCKQRVWCLLPVNCQRKNSQQVSDLKGNMTRIKAALCFIVKELLKETSAQRQQGFGGRETFVIHLIIIKKIPKLK